MQEKKTAMSYQLKRGDLLIISKLTGIPQRTVYHWWNCEHQVNEAGTLRKAMNDMMQARAVEVARERAREKRIAKKLATA